MALTQRILCSILLVAAFAAAALGVSPLAVMAILLAGLLVAPNRHNLRIGQMSPAWLRWVAVVAAVLLGLLATAALNFGWAEALPETWLWWLLLLPLFLLFLWNVWRPEAEPAPSN
jgi:hypothetical protein